MKRTINGACLAAAIGLAMALSASPVNSQVTIEKKTTTTNPSGTVVIENQTSRTFKLQGQTQTYTAPADFDLSPYSGKEVTVYTDTNGNVTKIEKKTVTAP